MCTVEYRFKYCLDLTLQECTEFAQVDNPYSTCAGVLEGVTVV